MLRHSSFIRSWLAHCLRRIRALWTGQYWTLEISHRYGNGVSLYLTNDDAYQALVRYVDEMWSSVFEDTDHRPDDDQAAIDAYFEFEEREWYETKLVYLGRPVFKEPEVSA